MLFVDFNEKADMYHSGKIPIEDEALKRYLMNSRQYLEKTKKTLQNAKAKIILFEELFIKKYIGKSEDDI